jgi:nicotinamide-nucleotide amidase
MQAEIITIGDEILIGQIIDSNSAFIAEKLNLIGIKVKQISSIADDREHILKALKEASQRVDLVIMTGGLGPTKDDITKFTLCEYFDTELVFHEDIYQKIAERFKKLNYPALESNKRQADLPKNCTVIPNLKGTASGMWFEKDEVSYVSMPGVPFEMKPMLENGVIPLIKEKFHLPVIVHRTLLTHGLGESFLAEKIKDWENTLPKNLKLAYLPSPEHLRLRLSISGKNREELENILDKEEQKLKNYIANYIFGHNKQNLQEVVGSLLTNVKGTIATAESCTGGNVARLITSVSGASAYFKGAIIAYSNEIKEKVLNVNPDDIKNDGAVSESVVKQMAIGVKNTFNTDYAIATSGIAGPGGGTDEKPVGTVWIAVAGPDKVIAKKFIFGHDRDINIRRASSTALDSMRRLLLNII